MRLFVPLVVLVVALAGCSTTPTTPTPQGPTAPASLVYAPDCTIGGGAWNESCVALASPNPSPSKTEIEIAVNPTDPLNVIVASKDLDQLASDCVWSVAQVTHDGGKTWKTVYIGGKKADRLPTEPLYPWACITDPIMAFDSKGVVYYTLQAYDLAQKTPLPVGSTGSAMFLARSTNGGDSWDKIIVLHAGEGTAVFHDYIRMATNPKTGSVYSVWNQISLAVAAPVLVASRDGGETAAPPVYITSPENPGNLVQQSIAAANDGTVYVILGAGADVFLATSTDDGMTFSAPAKIFSVNLIGSTLPGSTFRTFTAVELAVDKSDGPFAGCLYAVWSDAGAGAGDADIHSSRSCDKGKTWSEASRVNRDPTKSDQFMTRVVVDNEGTVFAAYMTRAYDPANKLIDAEIAYSTDGGATWTAKRLTQTSFDGDLGIHQDGFPFFGDYIGLDSTQGRTYMGFPATTTGVAEIGVASLAKQG